MKRLLFSLICFLALAISSFADETRLLRQPTISETHIAYTYGSDLWVTNIENQQTVRLTSTGAVESDPLFSPDGLTIAFTSNRSGSNSVYTVPVEGGTPTRLTWHPATASVRCWTPDGKKIVYTSTRETAPAEYGRLWTVSKEGSPSVLLSNQWGTNCSFSADSKRVVIDRISRWDIEWRAYRGGQNTPLIILNLDDNTEELLPNEKQTDTQPLWLGETIYFLSDRDWTTNIWSYSIKTKEMKQITKFKGSDIKSISGKGNKIVFERDGYLNILNLINNEITQLSITIKGDFPWAETKWEDITESVSFASLSPTGKRAIMESRGEIFTIPVEHGNARNITNSSGAADRAPLWSPKGDKVAWFSDADGKGYSLMTAEQDGLSEPVSISIGESKLAWEPTWSPDGKFIAFTDDDVRVRIIDIETKTVKTIDTGGNNLERGSLGLTWSPDSKWLAYAKSASNSFRQITVWSQTDNSIHKVTNTFADAFSPAWDLNRKHLYFLASTELALGSGWANTSSMTAEPNYQVYIINLKKDEPSPFNLRSDEEPKAKEEKEVDEKAETDKKEDKKPENTSTDKDLKEGKDKKTNR